MNNTCNKLALYSYHQYFVYKDDKCEYVHGGLCDVCVFNIQVHRFNDEPPNIEYISRLANSRTLSRYKQNRFIIGNKLVINNVPLKSISQSDKVLKSVKRLLQPRKAIVKPKHGAVLYEKAMSIIIGSTNLASLAKYDKEYSNYDMLRVRLVEIYNAINDNINSDFVVGLTNAQVHDLTKKMDELNKILN